MINLLKRIFICSWKGHEEVRRIDSTKIMKFLYTASPFDLKEMRHIKRKYMDIKKFPVEFHDECVICKKELGLRGTA